MPPLLCYTLFLLTNFLLIRAWLFSRGPVKIYAQNYLQARLSEVSRQRRRRPEPPPSASCSCTSCSSTGYLPHGGAGRRPASGRSCHRGMSPPRGSCGGFPGSAARSRCWCGCGSSARWENLSRSASPQCRPRPSWQPPSVSWLLTRRPQLLPFHGRLFCSPGRGPP